MTNKNLSVLKFKEKAIFVLLATLIFNGCSSDANSQNTSSVVTKTAQTSGVVITDNLPDSSDDASLQDKYDVQDFIQSNKVLEKIPNPPSDYKVDFTSDGGAVFFTGDGGPVFSIKATQNKSEISWSRKNEQLLFDTLQVINVMEKGTKIYARYSQLLKTGITVKDSEQQFSKSAELVQTVGLGLIKSVNDVNISGFTPVVLRLPDKNSLPYKIEQLSLKAGNTTININEKSIVKWPGFNSTPQLKDQKVNIEVSVSSKKQISNLAVILGLHGKQIQLSRISEFKYSGEILVSELETPDTFLTVELIDKDSFDKNSPYSGYSWIIPYLSD